MHRCTEVHESFSILSNLIHGNNEQHVELGRSQKKKRDNTNLQKVLLCFSCHDTFDLAEFCIKSLHTGLVASDDINCDNAETAGETIQNAFSNICIEDTVISRKARVGTLQFLKPDFKIDSKTVDIDPLILFTRLTALIQRDGKVEENFKNELTPEPTTLFKNGICKISGKSVLRNHLII